MDWNEEDQQWIYRMDELFTNLFGPDYCEYEYTEKKHCVVVPGQFPLIQYQHEEWEQTIKNDIPRPVPQQHSRTTTKVKLATTPKTAGTPQQLESSITATMSSITAAAKAAPTVFSNAVATSARGRSTKQGDPIRTREPDSEDPSQNVLRIDRINLLTRGEIAALALPRVASISSDDIILAQNQTEVKNPLSVNQRLSESTVEHALKLLREDSKTKNMGPIDVDSDDDDCDDKATVTLGHIGTFSKESVDLFRTMCTLASVTARVREEQRWLSKDDKSLPGHLSEVRDVLLNSRLKEEIIRQGTCIMDATDFSTLACERYFTGFAIDAICSKFLEDSKPVEIVFLPSFSQAWAMQGGRYFSQMVRPFFGHCAVNKAKYILSPLHFDTPKHWGVLCFNTVTQTVYFDDGLKLSPPRDTIILIKNMLSGFKWLSNHENPQALDTETSDVFQVQEWNQPKLALPLPRINMPRQTTTGEGAASCGIGVILSVRDIMKSQTCPAPFQWVFEDMSSLRKELMTLVLQWKK